VTRRTELDQFERLGADTVILAPVGARGHALGALTLLTNTPGRSLTKKHLPLVEDLAHRVGLAVDNARLYRLQEQMAQQMQLSLLPRLPDIAHCAWPHGTRRRGSPLRSAVTGTTAFASVMAP
jgi:sigma-B regulation protein RsbU (phosphoserine phosphatase)